MKCMISSNYFKTQTVQRGCNQLESSKLEINRFASKFEQHFHLKHDVVPIIMR